MDSLMTIEAMTTLRKQFQCEMPALGLLHGDGSARGLAEILLPRLLAARPETRSSP